MPRVSRTNAKDACSYRGTLSLSLSCVPEAHEYCNTVCYHYQVGANCKVTDDNEWRVLLPRASQSEQDVYFSSIHCVV